VEDSGESLIRFSAEGEVLQQINHSGRSIREFEPVGSRGLVLLAYAAGDFWLEVLGTDGALRAEWPLPRPADGTYGALALDPEGRAWVMATDGEMKVVDLSRGRIDAPLWPPQTSARLAGSRSIAFDRKGTLYVLISGFKRIGPAPDRGLHLVDRVRGYLGELDPTLTGDLDTIPSKMAVSPDGSVALLTFDQHILIFEP
jgi:hypothetical protein